MSIIQQKNKKPRLLYIQDQSVDSGKAGVVQIAHMCSAFQSLGIEVTIATPDFKKPQKEIIKSFEKILGRPPAFDVKTYMKLRCFGRFAVVGGYIGACNFLSKSNADICYLRNPLFIRPAMKNNIKVIYEAHNSIIHARKFLNKIWTRRLIKDSHSNKMLAFIAISNALLRYWRENGVPAKKSFALHDAVNLESFKDMPKTSTLRRNLKLPQDKKIIAYTGSLYADREIENIIELARIYSKTLFVVVGGPDEAAKSLRKKATNNGINNIIFVGKIPHPQVSDYLFAADVLLMVWSRKVPTINYCSPLKVFEYMAAGRTIVGHGFPTIKEVLTDGENALLSDPDSFEDLRLKVGRALKMQKNNDLAKASRKLAFRYYSWETRASRILKIIDTYSKSRKP